MVQQTQGALELAAAFDHHVVLFPARRGPRVLSELPVRSAGRAATGRRGRLRTRTIRGVVVIEVLGWLGDVVQDLDWAIQLALAEGPRGVVCDLSGIVQGAWGAAVDRPESCAVEMLRSAGRHGRDWSGVPVAVACPDPRLREALGCHPLGEHLVLAESLFSAVTAVLATPTPSVEWLHLTPHPTARRASRNFVTRTLLDWQLGSVIPFASLVVSDLVAGSSVSAGTGIDLSLAWNLGTLRLAVRDHGPAVAGQRPSVLDLDVEGDPNARGLAEVADRSRTFGVLPAGDGGKVVWVVIAAPRPCSSSARVQPVRLTAAHLTAAHLTAAQTLPVFAGGRRMALVPLSVGGR